MFKRFFTTTALLGTIALSNVGCIKGVMDPANPVEKTSIIVPCIATADLTGDGRVDASDVSAYAWLMRVDLNGDASVDTGDQQLLGAVLQRTPADFNGDGYVDASDFSAYAAATARADFNGSGSVDASDVSFFAMAKQQLDLNGDHRVNPEDLKELDRQLNEVDPCSSKDRPV